MQCAHFTRSACYGLVVWMLVAWSTSVSASLLWRIEKNGKRNFILGTIHVSDRHVLASLNRIENILQHSQELVLEVKQDADTRKIVARYTQLDHGTLQQKIGSTLFQRVGDALKSRGIQPSALMKMKLWAVGLMLNFPRPTLEPVLDERLQILFQRAGKPVSSLETVAEQLDIFDRLTMPEQIQFLQYSLDQSKEFDINLSRMKNLYLKGEIDAIYALAQDEVDGVGSRTMDKLMRNLLDVRNQRMFERMQPFLSKSGVLFAVGALHLPGKQGLLQKIRSAGFTLSPVYP